jgi:hypothetical protein
LAINASLETTKHRQAKEIRDLRRKLRESRLTLPPRAYRALQADLDHDDTEDEDDGEMEHDNGDEQLAGDDEAFKRVKMMVEGLIESGKRALEAKPDDFTEGRKGNAKVLSAEEVRYWQGDDLSVDSDGHIAMLGPQDQDSNPLVASTDDDDERHFTSNYLVRSFIDPLFPPSTPQRPPIKIIPST